MKERADAATLTSYAADGATDLALASRRRKRSGKLSVGFAKLVLMHLYLVRHAKAGSRQEWDGPDELRPLSKKGRRQADALVRQLFDRPIRRVLSSPSARCVETVEGLAHKLGLEVEPTASLTEDVGAHEVLDLVRRADRGTVLCTHGDVIPTVLDGLASEDGLKLPDDYLCAKGATWQLTKKDGRFVNAHYIPPGK